MDDERLYDTVLRFSEWFARKALRTFYCSLHQGRKVTSHPNSLMLKSEEKPKELKSKREGGNNILFLLQMS